MNTHKHHIVPRHAGGTNDPANLVELTIEEHSQAHKLLYEQYGRWQDRVAWLSLAGIMKDEERIYEILKNSNPGGYKHTEEIKQKLSIMRQGDKNPMYGKKAANSGTKRPGIGGRKKGTGWSDSERKTQEAVRASPGYYEYTQDSVRNKRISDAHKGKIGAATGKTWYNNTQIETYSDVCPDGFAKGRLPKSQINKRGLLWYNNGTVNKQFKENMQLQGFSRGRLTKK